MTGLLWTLTLASALAGADLPDDYTPPAAPGPYVGPFDARQSGAADWPAGTPLVATTYFYWYDAQTGGHVVDPDGTDALTDHPPTLEGFSYRNVDWHARQLEDMQAAGIDIALPVYWGEPSGGHSWSDAGLPQLVAARRRLVEQGRRPPAIGMFYDTSTLRHNGGRFHVDLTTPAGRAWFYATIRNFWSLIPPEHRATIDGRPLVLLYGPSFAKAVDEKLFPAVREAFRRDFGADLFLVKMRGWPGEADSEYMWGGAIAPQLFATAAIGPGYDHSAVPGRTPLVRPRDDGEFYTGAWEKLLARDPARRAWLVHLETWNEFHEGTDICESKEYGRQYIGLTRTFADKFHAGQRVDLAHGAPRPAEVWARPGESSGIAIAAKPDGDGPVVEQTVAGRPAWTTTENARSARNRYLYFDVDDAFLFDGDETVEVTVCYHDAGPEAFAFQYDSADPELEGLRQQFREGFRQEIGGTGQWKEATFSVPHARFAGGANLSDFRLACADGDLAVAGVTIRPAAAPAPGTAACDAVHRVVPAGRLRGWRAGWFGRARRWSGGRR